MSLMGRPLKPETDPDWEDTKAASEAAHKAKRQRGLPSSPQGTRIKSKARNFAKVILSLNFVASRPNFAEITIVESAPKFLKKIRETLGQGKLVAAPPAHAAVPPFL